MEELELVNIPGFGSVGVVLKINNKTAKKISEVITNDKIYHSDSTSWAPNWIQKVNKEVKIKTDQVLITTTEGVKITINLQTNSKNYIWLFDDD